MVAKCLVGQAVDLTQLGEPEPTDYWLSTLPPGIRLRELVRLAKIRRRIEHEYRELRTGLGLTHFE
ncbi:SRSO17 transposase [Nonomuraea thailandensis]|uniref:SRSO17 transposase n=1 Tax=Nonomuraea thailandensis TaxID=1188745 RepID=A0A9X2K237_9ACTN|nr:SRSO17 transposase [Nonomuraea thailandensis]